MYYFQPGWEPEPHMTEGMAKQLIMSALQNHPNLTPEFLAPPPPMPSFPPTSPPPSVQALHIGQYVQHMMNDLDYTLLDLTITKDQDGNLVFEVINKEK